MMTTVAARVLPATGRTVPAEPAYVLSSLQQMRTLDGVAYNAKVRDGKTLVGLIENRGDGGGTWFSPVVPGARERWERFTADYYALNPPENVTDPAVRVRARPPADALIDELDLSKRLDRSVRKGVVVLRTAIRDAAARVAWENDGYPTVRFSAPRVTDHARVLDAAKRHPSCAGDKYDTYLPGRGWVPLNDA